MEFTFHNSYIILGLAPCAVIFWTEIRRQLKTGYSNKATMHQGWSHYYKTSIVVITNWLNIIKYPFIKWQWILSLLCTFISFPTQPSRHLPDLTISVTSWASPKNKNYLPVGSSWVHLALLVWSVLFFCFSTYPSVGTEFTSVCWCGPCCSSFFQLTLR